MRHIPAALACAILAACGGGGSATPDKEVTVQMIACTPADPTYVDLYGDSTQDGWDGGTMTYVDPPSASLQHALDVRFGIGRVFVRNRAMSGTTSVDGLEQRLSEFNPEPGKHAPIVPLADVIVMNWGINDMTHFGPAGIDAYKDRLRELSRTSAQVVLETPNPVKGYDVSPWANAMRDVAAEMHLAVADTYAYVSAKADWEVLIPDWAHPGQRLYDLIGADVLAPAVIPLVKRARCER